METAAVIETDTPGEVLAAVRDSKRVENLETSRQLRHAVAWALMHSVDSIDDAATFYDPRGRDTGCPVAGAGAPLVAEFAIAEFAAALGLPTEHGKSFLGEALELAYRLPRVWARIQDGEAPAWRGRRIAAGTMHLSVEAVAYVDRHIGPVAHKVGPVQTDRLIDEAIGRFMPDLAEETRRNAADSLHFDVDHQQVSFAGTSQVWGELDLADALDLDAVVAAGAEQRKALGSEESLDVRRARAVGDLARRQLALDLSPDPEAPVVEQGGVPAPIVSKSRKPGREVVLYVHLSEDAITGAGSIRRVENGGHRPITAEQIRLWCGQTGTQVTVKPVIDLRDHVHVNSYEVPDRIAERIALRDHNCVFPWCTKPARKLKSDGYPCDSDHVVPWRQGGETCACQLAPLCRRHHRVKTRTAWCYTILEPGSYLWTSPHEMQFLRDHEGTLAVNDGPLLGGRVGRAATVSRPPPEI